MESNDAQRATAERQAQQSRTDASAQSRTMQKPNVKRRHRSTQEELLQQAQDELDARKAKMELGKAWDHPTLARIREAIEALRASKVDYARGLANQGVQSYRYRIANFSAKLEILQLEAQLAPIHVESVDDSIQILTNSMGACARMIADKVEESVVEQSVAKALGSSYSSDPKVDALQHQIQNAKAISDFTLGEISKGN